jgi:hypothetical protein
MNHAVPHSDDVFVGEVGGEPLTGNPHGLPGVAHLCRWEPLIRQQVSARVPDDEVGCGAELVHLTPGADFECAGVRNVQDGELQLEEPALKTRMAPDSLGPGRASRL